MRWLRIVVVFALFAVVGVGVIQAADDNGVPTFGDGRVNNWQMDEPVAIYCIFDNTQDVNVGIFQRIDVWGLNGNKLLEASAAQIDAAKGAATLDSANGYALDKLADGSFQVSAPNGYTFTWQRGVQGC